MKTSPQLTTEQAISRAKKAAKQGKIAVAEELYSAVLQYQPNHPIAKKGLRKIQNGLSRNQSMQVETSNPSQDQTNTLINLYHSGQMIETERACRELLTLYPQALVILNILGAALQGQGKLQEAVTSYNNALQIRPDYVEAHNNRGNALQKLGQLDDALASYNKAIQFRPDDYADAYSNRGIVLKKLGRLQEALASYNKAIQIRSDYAEAYSNRGVVLQDLGQLEEALASCDKAIQIRPDYAEAYSNRGAVLQDLGQLEEALASCDKAIQIRPDYVEAYISLGMTLYLFGRLDEAAKFYMKAIKIKPDLRSAWSGLFFTLKGLQLSTNLENFLVDLYDDASTDISYNINRAIIEYELKMFPPDEAATSFTNVTKVLSSELKDTISNPKVNLLSGNELIIPNKMVALLHFGRSGTGLLHSLVDNHPEVSTLPSIYFSAYFDPTIWKKLTAGGWEKIPELFVETFPVLFDANSLYPVPSMNGTSNAGLGIAEGMNKVGENRNESLFVDKDLFCAALYKLMGRFRQLNPMDFFILVHLAYEQVLGNSSCKNTIFYHIHNPDTLAISNFLRHGIHNVKFLMMVREPLQSCESWIRHHIDTNDYGQVTARIIGMLHAIDQIAFKTQDSVGLRLEDLKNHPTETIDALCNWMAIEEQPSLYHMSAQGKKWWGDPSSPDYGKNAMSPFGSSSINRGVGDVFSERDQFVLQTLFYPFSVRFGYIDENPEKFRRDLQNIKPMLNGLFDFEKKMANESGVDSERFMRSGQFLSCRAELLDRWKTLDEFNGYPHMLAPLKLT